MTTERENNHNQSGSQTAVPPATGIHTDPVESFKCDKCGETIVVQGLPSFSEIACPKCGTKASVPARLSNFLLLKLMGTGGMGGVYYARDEELGRFVAIKVMLESLGSDPAFIETFRREAQAVAKLNHPNIAQIYSYGQEKGQPYIVMELVSGERVDTMIDAGDRLKPSLAMRIGLEIAQGLSAADEAGLVHGDIKPENILLDLKGRAKLVDFGLATVAHQAAGEGIWGTPYYIAPEKIRRQKVDARSDIYSLGATLFHMLTGKPPFEGETPVEVVKARLEKPAADPREHIPELPEIVATTIKRMLAADRTERYPNYLSLISDLRRCVEAFGGIPAPIGRLNTGKQIRIKRRRGGGNVPSTVRNEPASTTGSSKYTRDTPTGTGPISINTSKLPAARPEPTPEEIAARKERGRRLHRNIWITLVTIVLLLAVAGGTTAWWLHRQEEIAKRKALFALSNARRQSSELYTTISNQVGQIVKYAERADSLVTDIHEAVERVTGSRLKVALPALPVAPVADAASTNAVTKTAAATNAAPGKAAEPETPEAARQDDSNTATADADDATDADTGDADIAPATTVPDHPMVGPAREGLQIINEIVELKPQASDILAAAHEFTSAVQAGGNAVRAREDTAKLRELGTQVADMLELAKKRFGRAKAQHERVMAFRQEFERGEKARIAAEKAAEQARIATEKAERERQALIARTALEIQQAKNDRADMMGWFDANDYGEALEQLKQRAANYQTEQGKAAIQILIDRYEYLTRMKTTLIAGMQKTRYPWGWGSGASARDIETADAKGITVKGAPAPIPWSSVTTPQMLKIVDFYLSSRDLRARQRIDIAFGAAIYCDMFGKQARERAQQYANRAMDLGLSRDTFDRLIEAGWLEALE